MRGLRVKPIGSAPGGKSQKQGANNSNVPGFGRGLRGPVFISSNGFSLSSVRAANEEESEDAGESAESELVRRFAEGNRFGELAVRLGVSFSTAMALIQLYKVRCGVLLWSPLRFYYSFLRFLDINFNLY
jgi:hypothetical protein